MFLMLQNLYNFLAQSNVLTSLSLAGTECALEAVSTFIIHIHILDDFILLADTGGLCLEECSRTDDGHS